VPLRYRVEGYVTDGGLKTSRVIEVGEAASVVASDLLREDPEERRLTDDAAEVILDVLANGEASWATIKAALRDEGISEHTGRIARTRLKQAGAIERHKTGLRGGWLWRIAELATDAPGPRTDGRFEDANGKFELATPNGTQEPDGKFDVLDAAEANVKAVFTDAVVIGEST
jgi:hypothetical protein